MIELNKIYNEDCLEGMKRIPDGSVDCIVCDLPYGVLNGESEGGSWDTIIPFANSRAIRQIAYHAIHAPVRNTFHPFKAVFIIYLIQFNHSFNLLTF